LFSFETVIKSVCAIGTLILTRNVFGEFEK